MYPSAPRPAVNDMMGGPRPWGRLPVDEAQLIENVDHSHPRVPSLYARIV